jgi:predicted dehydrogenase
MGEKIMRQSRREFLRTTGVAAGAALMTAGGASRVLGANERIVVGLIGSGGRGKGLAQGFAGMPNVDVAWACDPDAQRRAGAQRAAKAPRATADLRQVLDDKDVDAVVIATCDHWHGPAAILACQAGKHVYVEKPCSHNIREGRLMVAAARANKRVMQVGTQSRSGEVIREGIGLLREGAIGDVLVAKAVNSQRRGNIGHAKPSKPPKGLDYDLWVGPAPMVPFQSNRYHYTWHWWYAFGTGDIGNDGSHEIDIARWGLGVTGHPSKAGGSAAKLFFDDDQQFPDTMYITYEYPAEGKGPRRRMLVFEQRIWSPYRQEDMENGNVFYGTKGMMVLSKGWGYKLFGPRNKLVKEKKGGASSERHQADFLDAIRTGRKRNADIEHGHGAATLCHLGNIVARVGREVAFDPKTERITGDEEAARLVGREYRKGHWAVPKGA